MSWKKNGVDFRFARKERLCSCHLTTNAAQRPYPYVKNLTAFRNTFLFQYFSIFLFVRLFVRSFLTIFVAAAAAAAGASAARRLRPLGGYGRSAGPPPRRRRPPKLREKISDFRENLGFLRKSRIFAKILDFRENLVFS